MSKGLFDQLQQEGLLSEDSLHRVQKHYAKPVISLQKDINVILYVGVLLLSAGLSILVYKNIDRIGHLAILSAIGAICIFCYAYGFRKSSPFSRNEVESPDALYDYLLVLGGLTMVIFMGYLQYQYHVFGNSWNLAGFIPMVLLFITAYYFDQLGVLSLAILNLAAWLGIIINRVKWPFLWNLDENHTIYTAILLGIFLVGMSYFSRLTNLKSHFSKLYHQFGTHIFFISCITSIVHFNPQYWPWFFLLLAGSVSHLIKAFKESSFYYLVVAILYLYIGISIIVVDLLKVPGIRDEVIFQRNLIYFIISPAGLAYLLVRLNNKLKTDAGIR